VIFPSLGMPRPEFNSKLLVPGAACSPATDGQRITACVLSSASFRWLAGASTLLDLCLPLTSNLHLIDECLNPQIFGVALPAAFPS
jgi:hypothetical protein